MRHLLSCSPLKNLHDRSSALGAPVTPIMSLHRLLSIHLSPVFLQLLYFIIMSLLGFLGLKISKPRIPVPPNAFDLFFTSVSASTVSSLSVVEMEAFSNSQLILIIFLMFLGGEVFISMLGLLFSSFILSRKQSLKDGPNPLQLKQRPPIPSANQIEIRLVSIHKQNDVSSGDHSDANIVQNDKTNRLKHNSIKCLGFVILGYLAVLHMVGSGLVSSYISIIPSARKVLRNKGINIHTFSVFTIVSTFASCGFVPTNENMFVFRHNPGLLLLILPFVFLGSTLYPPFLRLVIWILERVTKREEFSYIQRNYEVLGYDHMLSGVHCLCLAATVLGLNLTQFVLFCCMEWKSENMEGLNSIQKLISSLFQISNVRHAGESVVDLSTLSSATLVLFVVMMYLPPYTTFLPTRDPENDRQKEKISLRECLMSSQLSYLVMFIILICITESRSLREDPLNFNVFNIALEVMSAYGNVGFSMGYSCKLRLKADGNCRDKWFGFAGRWSSKGKLILIVVMVFGRVKKFNINGGKPWLLS
ncbi:sodium transporter HKT1-like [Neltuma alba]|uniref:sodium transporter HKT1-like n=1 Tax=Neltuma alba TaxID=207710 RepID=UPI0010A523BE|nr:sodium transporter HKT1-like [Prosopis alba]